MRLQLTDVGYTYAPGTSWSLRALSGVTLAVEAGTFVLVVGATGSGKSTLLRVASGLLEPSEGTVTIDGDVLRSAAVGRDVGIIFQDPEAQLFAETVLDDVAFGPLNLGMSHEAAHEVAREALDSVGLPPEQFGERSPFTLSGGEARKAAIAGVLAMRPHFLLADEPTAGLDAGGRDDVRSVLGSIRETTGVVVVTHDAEEFLAEADEVLVLGEGKSVFAGTASELVADPAPFFAAGLLPPEVLRVQLLARDSGFEITELTLDPFEAAARLSAAIGGRS